MEEYGEMFVPGKKKIYYANKYLNAGNQCYLKQKYFESLENFNKCLCHADKESEEFHKAWKCRLKLYDSINAINPERFNESPWSFFKLSHPASKKNSNVIEYLQVKNNDVHFGRYVFTNRNLKTGEIIAIEEPFFKFIDPSARHFRCSNCLKSNKLNLIPSELCSSSMFCSEDCKMVANNIYHHNETDSRVMEFTQRILLESLDICKGNFEKINEIMENEALSSKTAFDFDWSDVNRVETKMNKLLSFNALQVGPDSAEFDWINFHPILNLFQLDSEKAIALRFMKRAARILAVNCYSLEWLTPEIDSAYSYTANSKGMHKMKIGSGLFIFGSLFNHSCAPNIERILVDNKLVFFARRPIKEGQQLFISYGPSFTQQPNESRRFDLQMFFHFECCCEACNNNYPIEFNNMIKSRSYLSSNSNESSLKNWISEFSKNCDIINENFKKFPNRLMCRLMDRNLYLLAGIAKNEPYIFE